MNKKHPCVYGYIRVSSEKQNCLNQQHEILLYCEKQKININVWVEEVISSRKSLTERKLNCLLEQLRKNDILITTEISRLGRNMLEVMGILQKCMEKGCQIITIKENYHLGADIQSKVLAFAFSLAGEIERQLISQRTKECLKRLKDEGKQLGRPQGEGYRKLLNQHGVIKQLLHAKVPKAQIARTIGCSWITLHRYINECIEDIDIFD